MQNHRVHDTSVLPGVALLDVVLRCLVHHNIALETVTLERILFSEPLATTEHISRKVSVVIELPTATASGRIRVSSQAVHPGDSPTASATNMEARLVLGTPPVAAPALPTMQKSDRVIAMSELYRRARAEGIQHGSRMRCTGDLRVRGQALVAELALEQPGQEQFLLHPAALDASTIAAYGQMDAASREPYIPIYIDRFVCAAPLPAKFLLFAPQAGTLADSTEIIENDYCLYSPDGRLCAIFEKLSCKRIRTPDLITRLVTNSSDPGPNNRPAIARHDGAPAESFEQTPRTYTQLLRSWIAKLFDTEPADITTNTGFYELGLDSTAMVDLAGRLEQVVDTQLYPTLLFEYTDIDSLVHYLDSVHGPLPMTGAGEQPDISSPHDQRLGTISPAQSGSNPSAVCAFLAAPVQIRDPQLSPCANEVLVGRHIVASGLDDNTVRILKRHNANVHICSGMDFSGELPLVSSASNPPAVVLTIQPDCDAEEVTQTLARAVSQISAGTSGPVDIVVIASLTELHAKTEAATRATAALLRTVRQEAPRLHGRIIRCSAETVGDALVDELARAQPLSETAGVITWAPGRRTVEALCATSKQFGDFGAADATSTLTGAVCVISGGAGALAQLLAEDLIARHGARIALLGRSTPSEHLLQRWANRAESAAVTYHRCDVADPAQVHRALADVRRCHGPIEAVFHLAGTRHDQLHHRITADAITETFSARVRGFQLLDSATTNDPLRWFIAFSSLAAWLPNAGQSAYAAAEAALETLAEQRAASSDRPGRTLALSWPLWADGAMAMSAEQQSQATRRTGLLPLPTEVAINGFDAVLTSLREGVAAVLYGDRDQAGWVQPAMATADNELETSTPEPLSTNASLPQITGQDRPQSLQSKPTIYRGPLELAIVGLAGRYGTAETPDEIWAILSSGTDSIQPVPVQRWVGRGVPTTTLNAAGQRHGSFVDSWDRFDPAMFRISRRDAERMDPQERLFLETCWTAMEEAGYPATNLKRRDVGVFVGVMWNHYQLAAVKEAAPTAMHAAIANRVSYALDLTGPSLAVDTACSSSLTAISLAANALAAGHCHMALAGGVNLTTHPAKYLQLAEGGFLSADGRCRTFGSGGTGYVPGEGVGVVLLRPLADALADGDHIWGVLEAEAINHSGHSSGFSVPTPVGQAEVITTALHRHHIDPDTISYVEAHGTGTALGDPIEIDGLQRAFGNHRKPASVPIGSIKSIIGHLEGAAGIAGVTKVLLQFWRKQLLPSLHAETLNPSIDFTSSVFSVQRELAPWAKPEETPRRACVSAFGAGGANAHVILREPPRAPLNQSVGPQDLFPISARDIQGLREYAARLAARLRALEEPGTEPQRLVSELLGVDATEIRFDDTLESLGLSHSETHSLATRLGRTPLLDEPISSWIGASATPVLAAVAFTLQCCRTGLQERTILIAHSCTDLVQKLTALASGISECDTTDIVDNKWEPTVRRWLAGEDIDFASLWTNRPNTIHLPVPALGSGRYWVGEWQARHQATEETTINPSTPIRPPIGESEKSVPNKGPEPDGSDLVSVTELTGGIAIVAMIDSSHHNMFTTALLARLEHEFACIASRDDVRVVILTGTERTFSMGATPETLEQLARKESTFTAAPFLFEGLQRCPVPVIAAVRGHAAGGGFAFALHADIVILDLDGTYTANFAKYGFTPGLGATAATAGKLGDVLAAEMFFTADTYSGRELRDRGAAVRCVPSEDVLDQALTIARQVAALPPDPIRGMKAQRGQHELEKIRQAVDNEIVLHDQVLGDSAVAAVRARLAPRSAPSSIGTVPSGAIKSPKDRKPSRGISANNETLAAIQETVETVLSQQLFIEPDEINPTSTFSEMGLDSLGAVELATQLNKTFNLNLESVFIYDHPRLKDLVDAVATFIPETPRAPTTPAPSANADEQLTRQLLATRLNKPDHSRSTRGGENRSAQVTLPNPQSIQTRPMDSPTLLSIRPRASSAVHESRSADPKGRQSSTVPDDARQKSFDPIAIVGMSARYPGARNLDELWALLRDGECATHAVTAASWERRDEVADPAHAPGPIIGQAALLEDIDRFDAAFFGISPREAELMDPQQRLFLEHAYLALDHAGYAVGPETPINCGVFVGSASGDYLQYLRARNESDSGQTFLGNSTSVLAARIGYMLNLHGPTVSLDTACSSSLVALHLACQAIRSGDCDMALAGGVALMTTAQMHTWNARSGMLSARGRCASFDASADGFTLGEGVGVVVVKPLSAAIRDRDTVHAVIRASGINGDGKTNGIAAPSAASQLRLMHRVHADAAISANDISYHESHAAGTQLGDPIEAKALAEVHRDRSPQRGPCPIGSVKSNLGHTTLAAGIAGLLKVVLSMRHQTIVPTLHFTELNKNIPSNGQLAVVTKLQPWPAENRVATLSSFGVSGTNAYIVLADAPTSASPNCPAAELDTDADLILPVSAHSSPALTERLARLADDLADETPLADVAFTLCVGRAAMTHRAVVCAADAEEAVEAIRSALASELPPTVIGTLSASHEERAQAYLTGADIDWSSDAPRSGRRIALRPYPLGDTRHWIDDPRPHEYTENAWLRDHRVLGRSLVPAAALPAYIAARLERPVELSNLQWLRPADTDDANRLGLTTQTSADGTRRWCLEIDGTPVAQATDNKTGASHPDHIQTPLGSAQTVRATNLYRRFWAAGIEYGSSYRLLAEIRRTADQAEATLRIKAETHPVHVIDAALQLVAALIGSDKDAAPAVPSSAETLAIYGDLLTARTCSALRRADGKFDILARDRAHRPILAVTGFTLAPLGAGSGGRTTLDILLPAWLPIIPQQQASITDNDGAAVIDLTKPAPTTAEHLIIDARQISDDGLDGGLQNLRNLLASAARPNATSPPSTITVVTAGASELSGAQQRPSQAAIQGLAAAGRSELAGTTSIRLIDVDAGIDDPLDAMRPPQGTDAVRAADGRWFRRAYQRPPIDTAHTPAPPEGLTYLLVGGAGGLGRALSERLVRAGARVGWIGRRPLDARLTAELGRLRTAGATVAYEQADLLCATELDRAVRRIRRELGPISRAVHTAMVLRNAPLHATSDDDLAAVLGPKVVGIRNLTDALEPEPLDQFLIFSSVASIVDSPGQANYAAASRYLDAWARLVRVRRGVPTTVVNWGYWGSIGAVAGSGTADAMAAKGIGSIDATEGFGALERLLSSNIPQVIILRADPNRYPDFGLAIVADTDIAVTDASTFVSSIAPHPRSLTTADRQAPNVIRNPDGSDGMNTAMPSTSAIPADAAPLNAARNFVRNTVAKVLKLPAAAVELEEPLQTYGVDSMMAMELLRALESQLGELPTTLFYEHLTVGQVADYLRTAKREAFAPRHSVPAPAALNDSTQVGKTHNHIGEIGQLKPNLSAISQPNESSPTNSTSVAIVGVSGRYPQAPDLDALWDKLRAGQSCLTQVPSERWDWRRYAGARQEPDRSYNHFGGFLQDVDHFDAGFFNILPRDAARIDPQERLFLQTCWDLLERAGHNGRHTRERSTGVFVGVMYGSYGQMAAAHGWPDGNYGLGHSSYWSIANRVSQFFDFTGPSMAIDTACSSSLSAVHLACQAIRSGSCRQAIAGGVNLILHPAHHIALSAMNMLSDGRACHTLDARADGFVPGEGVGAVLLRPLADAIADGDQILAVIRGSEMNASGRSQGYTVPNAPAQAAVITSALNRAGLRGSDLSYIELHGTGTKLGDPIEIAGLRTAIQFEVSELDAAHPVHVGSIKANLGHLEGAAGIAGLTSVLLQLGHEELVPLAGLSNVNPDVDLGERLRPSGQVQPWPANPLCPRIAGVSSFGAGGANTHLIVAEAPNLQRLRRSSSDAPLLLLSARHNSELREYARTVARWLRAQPAGSVDLPSVEWTSQVGRRALEVRLAVSTNGGVDELAKALELVADGCESSAVSISAIDTKAPIDPTLAPRIAQLLLADRDLPGLAAAWTSGMDIDWRELWSSPPPRCAFPTIPFRGRSYWFTKESGQTSLPSPAHRAARTLSDHPAGHPVQATDAPSPNRSLSPEEKDLEWMRDLADDHLVAGKPIVPGMALVAALLGHVPNEEICLSDVHWYAPIPAADAMAAELDCDGQFRCVAIEGTVVADARVGPSVTSPTGHAMMHPSAVDEPAISAAQFYDDLAASGLAVGVSLRTITRVQLAATRAIAWLQVPAHLDGRAAVAALLDGALQTLTGLIETPSVPAGVSYMWLSPLPTEAVAVATRSAQGESYELTLYDHEGAVVAEMRGITIRPTASLVSAHPTVRGQLEYLRVQTVAAPPVASAAPERVVLDGSAVAAEPIIAALRAHGHTVHDDGSADTVVHIPARADDADVAQTLSDGLNRLLALVNKIDAQHTNRPRRLIVALGTGCSSVQQRAVDAGYRAAIRTVVAERPSLSAVTIDVAALAPAQRPSAIAEHLHADSSLTVTPDGAFTHQLAPFTPATTSPLLRPGGTYLITGGSGELGRIFAGRLLDLAPVTVILAGRRVPGAQLTAWMTGRSNANRRLDYIQLDITQPEAVTRALKTIEEQHGPLNGVIHAAGLRQDARLSELTYHHIDTVVRPKVGGLTTLYAAITKPLDFLILCSSLATHTGNPGQFAYVAANACADELATRLGETLCKNTVSVAWPLWANGGMRVDPATERLFAETFRMLPLPNEAGLAAFEYALSGHDAAFAVVQRPRLGHDDARSNFSDHRPTDQTPASGPSDHAVPGNAHDLLDAVLDQLRALASEFLLVAPEQVDTNIELLDTGFDSISLTDLANRLNALYGTTLTPATFFSFSTLNAIARYLVTEEYAAVSAAQTMRPTTVQRATDTRQRAVLPDDKPLRADGPEPIAICGMAGRFASAANLDQLWGALTESRSLVSNPDDRRMQLAGRSFDQIWPAGYLTDIERFDAAAFGISPREAALMDPQHRLLLEVVSETLQDAGYPPPALAGRAIGLFAGVSTNDYGTLITRAGGRVPPHAATGVAHAILANRISYQFDWCGPSEVIDTACSSSLVALHRAISALRRGECEAAIVGGVNALLDSGLFQAFDASGMLSAAGRCASFDAAADGYVRGEGVGALFVKPLSAAQADNDAIHAVILGSAVGHNGHSPSLTAPRPQSQAQVLQAALADAHVEPGQVGYIEAHGTGTKLGDPVEIEGLKQVFAEATTPVAVGSVKTVVGHMEAAAGMAGLIRTALSLRNGVLTPLVHFTEKNPLIDLSKTPLRLLTEAQPWNERRIAGVSSFGFGGTNAHVVLAAAPDRGPAERSVVPGAVIVPVSAPSSDQLRRYCSALATRILADRLTACDVAFTLRTGRDDHPIRACVQASDTAELAAGLQAIADGISCHISDVHEPGVSELVARWIAGEKVTWPRTTGRRVHLPPIPFAGQRHWFTSAIETQIGNTQPLAAPPLSTIRPNLPPPRDNLTDKNPGDTEPHARSQVVLSAVNQNQPTYRAVMRPNNMAAPVRTQLAHTAPVKACVDNPSVHIRSHVTGVVVAATSKLLLLPDEAIDLTADFARLGLDSIYRMDLVRALNAELGTDIKTAELYEFSNLHELITALCRPNQSVSASSAPAPAPVAPERPATETPSASTPPPLREGNRGHDESASVTAAKSLVGEVVTLVSRVTNRPVQPGQSFEDAGLSSFDMLRVIAALESTVGFVPKSIMFDEKTPELLATWLAAERGVHSLVNDLKNLIPAVPAVQTGHTAYGTVLRKSDLVGDPQMVKLVAELDRQHAREGGLPGRDIAPLIFLSSSRDGYLNFTERDGLLLAWSCVCAQDRFQNLIDEWVAWARDNGMRPNLFAMQAVETVAGQPFTATPFGTVQRLPDISEFSLSGTAMQRLRHKISRFKSTPAVKLTEYTLGSDSGVDARVVALIDEWAERKSMVNPYVTTVRREFLCGKLAERHRLFLTSVASTIVAAIVITAIPSENGYLLDLEFGAHDMPGGAMEYAIVEIINILRGEGVQMFSFGATLGVKIASSANPHVDVETALEQMRKAKIFDGEGNFRFKNKFRPQNLPIFLCQPAESSAADLAPLVLLIADPSVTDRAELAVNSQASIPLASTGRRDHSDKLVVAQDSPRRAQLRRCGFNTLSIAPQEGAAEMTTDSWAERDDAHIFARARDLADLVEAACPELAAQTTLPFGFVHADTSGRAAEAALLRGIPRDRSIFQANLFPSWLFNLADVGLQTHTVPTVAATTEPDLSALAEAVDREGSRLGLIALELATNAFGGTPLTLDVVRSVRDIARSAGVPLVLDATRGGGNSALLLGTDSDTPDQAMHDLWRQMLELADAVTISLPKEWGVGSGGVVATDHGPFVDALRGHVADRGEPVSLAGRRTIAAALADHYWWAQAVRSRVRQVAQLASVLRGCGAPLAACGPHAVFLDVAAARRNSDERGPTRQETMAGYLAWLYEQCGVRAAPHLASGFAPGQDWVRLAVPVGLANADIESVSTALAGAFRNANPPRPLLAVPGPTPEYRLREEVPDDIAVDLSIRSTNITTGDNIAAIHDECPHAVRHLIEQDATSIEVVEAGSGPVIVLLHPFNIGLGFFAKQFAHLSTDYRVIGVHAAGVGASTGPADLSFEALADTVVESVRSLGVTGRFVIGGASFGGLTAQALAARHPDDVSGLVLLGSSHKVGNRHGEINRLEDVSAEDFAAIATAGGGAESAHEDARQQLLRCESMNPRIGLRYLDMFASRPDLLEKSRTLQVPTLIIHGELDTVIDIAIGRRLAEAIAGAQWQPIRGAGHFPSITAAAEVNTLIREFIRKCSTC